MSDYQQHVNEIREKQKTAHEKAAMLTSAIAQQDATAGARLTAAMIGTTEAQAAALTRAAEGAANGQNTPVTEDQTTTN
ncbi:hypothetical protein [Citricoccus nitrophenolicus]|uniref:hypothetical protein n=1 Tax=Citricoccus nitrophenolicus TaxID=863575 RepID=UPI0031EBF484